MALAMNQVPAALGWSTSGMGQAAAIVGSILGPVATGGADAYRTYADSEQGKKELKQRRREFEAIQRLQEQQAVAAGRQATIAEISAIQRARIAGAYQSSYFPLAIGALALGGLALVAVGLLRKKS